LAGLGPSCEAGLLRVEGTGSRAPSQKRRSTWGRGYDALVMPRPLGLRQLGRVAACATLALGVDPSRGAAAELPGARLAVVRRTGADACPDGEQLSTELSQRMTPSGALPTAPTLLTVVLEGTADEYVAEIRVEGRKHGERTLRAAGPSCDAL